MLNAFHHEFWNFPDPFSPFSGLETQMAQLRVMTRVSEMRRQIERREEGSWMSFESILDPLTGRTCRVTTSSHTSRTHTHSHSGNFDQIFNLFDDPGSSVVVEFPDTPTQSSQDDPENPVEIVEVIDSPPASPPLSETHSSPESFSIPNKASFIKLGEPNVVFLNPDEEPLISVSSANGTSSERIVKEYEPETDFSRTEKRHRRVGFCKTEVHFEPDSGKFNIVETDEKPAPTQLYRKKRRHRERLPKSSLPKLYFGSSDLEAFNSESERNGSSFINGNNDDTKYSKFDSDGLGVPSSKETLIPIDCSEIEAERKINPNRKMIDKINEETANVKSTFSDVKEDVVNTPIPKQRKNINESDLSLSFLGNVSPQLQNLLKSSVISEFDFKGNNSSKSSTKNITQKKTAIMGKQMQESGFKENTVSIKVGNTSTQPEKLKSSHLSKPVKGTTVKINQVDLNQKNPSKPDKLLPASTNLYRNKVILNKSDSFKSRIQKQDSFKSNNLTTSKIRVSLKSNLNKGSLKRNESMKEENKKENNLKDSKIAKPASKKQNVVFPKPETKAENSLKKSTSSRSSITIDKSNHSLDKNSIGVNRRNIDSNINIDKSSIGGVKNFNTEKSIAGVSKSSTRVSIGSGTSEESSKCCPRLVNALHPSKGSIRRQPPKTHTDKNSKIRVRVSQDSVKTGRPQKIIGVQVSELAGSDLNERTDNLSQKSAMSQASQARISRQNLRTKVKDQSFGPTIESIKLAESPDLLSVQGLKVSPANDNSDRLSNRSTVSRVSVRSNTLNKGSLLSPVSNNTERLSERSTVSHVSVRTNRLSEKSDIPQILVSQVDHNAISDRLSERSTVGSLDARTNRSNKRPMQLDPSNIDDRFSERSAVSRVSMRTNRLSERSALSELSVGSVRRTREPLRSFEKISNGWVGRCILQQYTPPKTQPVTSSIPVRTPSINNGGRKKGTTVIKANTEHKTVEKKIPLLNSRVLLEKKQFSLSREHLRSARLVKETVGAGRGRRDSERSDDSLARADNEVRAYMYQK